MSSIRWISCGLAVGQYALESAIKQVIAASGPSSPAYVDASINGLEGKLDAAVTGTYHGEREIILHWDSDARRR